MNILIAPNAFKNSLPASDVANALAQGLLRANPSFAVDKFPVADGGDGTAILLGNMAKGRKIPVEVLDPLGRLVNSSFVLSDDGSTAFIEMADASGLKMLRQDELSPLYANSFGTGQLILGALEAGVKNIILCLGGSATVDGGVGILQALGLRFHDGSRTLEARPQDLLQPFRIDMDGLDQRLKQTEFTVLCDVDNTLLGPSGSAAVFGPQKGAGPDEIIQLEEFLGFLDDAAFEATGRRMSQMKHGGAAGGTSAAVATFLNAKLVPGADYFLDYTGFNEKLLLADLVITGEGSLDAQTLEGKAPFAVAMRAQQRNIPVIGVAGRIVLEDVSTLGAVFSTLVPIGNQPTDLSKAMSDTHQNLVRTGEMIGKLIGLPNVNQTKTFQSDSNSST